MLKNISLKFSGFFVVLVSVLMGIIPDQVHINEFPLNGLLFSLYLPSFIFVIALPILISLEAKN